MQLHLETNARRHFCHVYNVQDYRNTFIMAFTETLVPDSDLNITGFGSMIHLGRDKFTTSQLREGADVYNYT